MKRATTTQIEKVMFRRVIGSINERGTIEALFKKGITRYSSWGELVHNAIDAAARKILFKLLKDYILLIDDGKGMDADKLEYMFDLSRESHAGDQSIGVAGIGAKAALIHLSKRVKTMRIFTREKNGRFLKVIFDANKIITEGKWNKFFVAEEMSKDEIVDFLEERGGAQSGTTIKIPIDDEINTSIKEMFGDRKKNLPTKERLDITCAKFNVEIALQTSDDPDNKNIMKPFDYFAGPDTNFYCGKINYPIHVFKNIDTYKFTFAAEDENGDLWYCKELAKGRCATKVRKFNKESRDEEIDIMTFIAGKRKDDEYFDPENPTMPVLTRRRISKFEQIWFEDSLNSAEKLCKMAVFRNRFRIGGKALWAFSKMSGGIGHQGFHTKYYTRTALLFNTLSKQNNNMDRTMGTMETKNLWDADNLPKQLTYLCICLQTRVADKIWNYFQRLTDAATKRRHEEQQATAPIIIQARWRGSLVRMRKTREAVADMGPAAPVLVQTLNNDDEFHDASDGSTGSASDASYRDGQFVQVDAHGSESDQDSQSETESVGDINYEKQVSKFITESKWKNKLMVDALFKEFYKVLVPHRADEGDLCVHGNMKGECPTAGCEN